MATMSNKKGSPKRLGRPLLGECRKVTENEVLCSALLKRSDLINCHFLTAQLSIQRCTGLGRNAKYYRMSDEDAAPVIEELERFWDR